MAARPPELTCNEAWSESQGNAVDERLSRDRQLDPEHGTEPTTDSTSTVPPWPSTRRLTVASPSANPSV